MEWSSGGVIDSGRVEETTVSYGGLLVIFVAIVCAVVCCVFLHNSTIDHASDECESLVCADVDK